MKKLLIAFLGLTTFLSCNQESDIIGQTSLDSVAPGIITNATVKNGPGSAKVSYVLPADADVSYVKATYKVNDKVTRTAIASYYNNELLLEGFGEVKPYTVTIVTVDQSRNESAPVEVVVNPEMAPVQVARQSLIVVKDFGGINIQWLNPDKKNLNIEVDVNDLKNNGFFVQNNVIYSAEAVGNVNVRGFAPVVRTFRITIVDRWGNRSEPFLIEIIPFEEIKIDLTKIATPTINFAALTTNPIPMLYDGILPTTPNTGNGLIANSPWTLPGGPAVIRPQVTMDFGKKVKLSRMLQWQRNQTNQNYLYNHLNTKTFKVYGSNTAPSADVNDYTGWILIQDGEIVKPSGLPLGQLSTADTQQAAAGHLMNFSIDTPAYRYFRYELTNNWSGNLRFQVAELQIFGNYEN